MYAVIKTGGKQYRVQEGDELFIEKLDVNAGDSVDFDEVLVVSNDDEFKVGNPFVKEANVNASVIEKVSGIFISTLKNSPLFLNNIFPFIFSTAFFIELSISSKNTSLLFISIITSLPDL